jgi:hypothetical protein
LIFWNGIQMTYLSIDVFKTLDPPTTYKPFVQNRELTFTELHITPHLKLFKIVVALINVPTFIHWGWLSLKCWPLKLRGTMSIHQPYI